MGRILHIAPARPGGAARRVKLAAAVLLAATCAGIALVARLGHEVPGAARQPAPAAGAPALEPALVAAPATAGQAVPAREAPAAPAPAACPLQSLQLALGRAAARTVCMDATGVQQNGSVRTFAIRAGDAEGWTLRIDMAERAVLAVSLSARDGRAYGCEAPRCTGQVSVSAASPGGPGRIALRDLRLASATVPGEATVNASLRVPPDEHVPGLACTGPSVTVSAASGALLRFCGQGGAGVEIADDGQRIYRFQDHEGRTLSIALDAAQRVAAVTWDGHACRGTACSGASTSSAEPGNDLAERSFFFGRTALFEVGTGARPRAMLVLDGTLVMPAQ